MSARRAVAALALSLVASLSVLLAPATSVEATADVAGGSKPTVVGCGYGSTKAYRSYIPDNMGHMASHWDAHAGLKYKYCKVRDGLDFSIPTGMIAYLDREEVHDGAHKNWCTTADPYAYDLVRPFFYPAKYSAASRKWRPLVKKMWCDRDGRTQVRFDLAGAKKRISFYKRSNNRERPPQWDQTQRLTFGPSGNRSYNVVILHGWMPAVKVKASIKP